MGRKIPLKSLFKLLQSQRQYSIGGLLGAGELLRLKAQIMKQRRQKLLLLFTGSVQYLPESKSLPAKSIRLLDAGLFKAAQLQDKSLLLLKISLYQKMLLF